LNNGFVWTIASFSSSNSRSSKGVIDFFTPPLATFGTKYVVFDYPLIYTKMSLNLG